MRRYSKLTSKPRPTHTKSRQGRSKHSSRLTFIKVLLVSIIAVSGVLIAQFITGNVQYLGSDAIVQDGKWKLVRDRGEELGGDNDRIVEVSLRFDKNRQPQLAITRIRVLNGTRPTYNFEEPEYELAIENAQGSKLDSVAFSVPNEIADPPPLDQAGEAPTTSGVILDQLDFPLNLSWQPAGEVVRLYRDGKLVVTSPLSRARDINNATNYWELGETIAVRPDNQTLDITFLSHNYQSRDGREQFLEDAERFYRHLLEYQPFSWRSDQIKIRAVFTKTDLGCRVVMSTSTLCNFQQAWNIINNTSTPTDTLAIIVNSNQYQGSGGYVPVAYNGRFGPEVFVHELGHSLAHLVDEYLLQWPSRTDKNCYAGQPPNQAWQGVVSDDNGYYLECNFPDWYRSSPDSIMRSITARYFNPISQVHINEALDVYAGPLRPKFEVEPIEPEPIEPEPVVPEPVEPNTFNGSLRGLPTAPPPDPTASPEIIPEGGVE